MKAKKIKLLATPSLKTPTINLRTAKGRVPEHPPGDGYDSEASDRELDPTIEEQFILRLLPGEDCDYLRRMIEERKIGLPRDKGGADVSLKFIDDEGRRAVINIRGNLYAAALLDLPTITESMKTWDRKAFMKTADICQMLMVLARVRTEAEAKSIPLPKQVDNGYRWPHGLTPPMHDCVHRRFRKTVSRREIENKEAEVERLLAEDEDAEDTRWEWVDDRKAAAGRARTDVSASVAAAGRAGYDQDADAEAEEDDTHDYFGAAVANGYRQKLDVGEADAEGEEYGEADLTADLEADLEAEFEAEMNSPTAGGVVESAEATDTATTPALFDEEEEEDEDEDEEEDSDIDEDEQARLDELKGVREDIEELKKQIASKEDEYARQANAILRKRLEESIKKLKSELQLKMSSIGEVDDD